ncbi:hypothetical protein QBC46DRAFT_311823 [Diplogelasinospora grovesii]|uniref:Letm1 RBD domain-containing protein n=1 Tax=Diplogelasinospora grovesii TaxID=303347 RepID=A0AAN6N9W4_9PEZI|nr:hypothetical protein QBC46DRAFT_311823 [Diplogelasinospora grovesii]
MSKSISTRALRAPFTPALNGFTIAVAASPARRISPVLLQHHQNASSLRQRSYSSSAAAATQQKPHQPAADSVAAQQQHLDYRGGTSTSSPPPQAQPTARKLAPDSVATQQQHPDYSPSYTPQHRSPTTTTSSPEVDHRANPPATTRPPPLDLPQRQPDTSTITYLFKTGKAYLTFYKTGLKHIWTNTQLVYKRDPNYQTLAPPGTRSELVLKERWRHDVRRLPVFALLLLICGEFTPLVVLAVPSIVPFTCRIPAQVNRLQRQLQERRASSFAAIAAQQQTADVVVNHLAQTLGVAGKYTPGFLAARKVERRLKFLAEDDRLLVQAGGVDKLEADEVRLACVDRGIDVLDRPEGELRGVLNKWLDLTVPEGREDVEFKGQQNEGVKEEERKETERRISLLLMKKENEWPTTWSEAEEDERDGEGD